MPLDDPGRMVVFVRPRANSAAALAGIVRAAETRGLGLRFDDRLSSQLTQAVLPYYSLALVSGALGALALVLASVGLYGLMTFAVNQRVREIGVRMALGATARLVVMLFVGQGMRLVVIGLALGLIGGGLLALLLGRILYGLIDAFDPAAFVAVTLLFAVIALFACWLPARRATKVDPMVALRTE
jgi:ABC-type antimicrobial peptide transport system permease subunit